MTIEKKIEDFLKKKGELKRLDLFNWEKHSHYVAEYCPQYFDAEKFNWTEDSWAVIEFCPQYFDTNRYNWKEDSDYIAEYAPQYLDPEKYNWEKASVAITRYAPKLIDPKKFNWRKCTAWWVFNNLSLEYKEYHVWNGKNKLVLKDLIRNNAHSANNKIKPHWQKYISTINNPTVTKKEINNIILKVAKDYKISKI